jgi:prophage DNA circulation protein
MADAWETFLYTASFGGIDFHLREAKWSHGQALARYQQPRRAGQRLAAMGDEPRVTQAQILFFGADYLERYKALEKLKAAGRTEVFVHPLLGPIRAKIGQFAGSAAAEPREAIALDVTFEEDTDGQAITTPGPGSPLAGGLAQVQADLALLTAGMDAYNERYEPSPSEVTMAFDEDVITADEIEATVTTWEDTSADVVKTATQVELELADLSARLDAEIERLELATDIRGHAVLVAFVRLHASVRRAAQAVKARTPRVIEIVVEVAAPLRVLAARLYGADQADAQYTAMLSLNDIKNPTRIEPGTTLRAQAPSEVSDPRLRSPQ